MQRIHCTARQRVDVLSAPSLLALAVSDVLASCRRTATAPRRRDTQAALVLATAVVFAVASVPARAQDATWTGTESSNWFGDGNWSNGVPTEDTAVNIGATSNLPEIDGDDAYTGTLTVGASDAGSLSIVNGGTLSSSYFGRIGEGAEGVVSVTGAGSSWTALHVIVGSGTDSIGRLAIVDGGVVEAAGIIRIGGGAGSVGRVTVEGVGSRFFTEESRMFVGSSGTGTLVLQEGGQADSGFGSIGLGEGSAGEVTVTGAGSNWDIAYGLQVGVEGSGTLLVEAGGMVWSGGGIIGEEGGSVGEATVTGAGSSWLNRTNFISVGHAGSGTLLVEAGGTVTNLHAYIGLEEGSVGKATVTGAGSTWTSDGALYVGNAGTGTLEILDGGTVSNHDGVIGNEAGSAGKATVTGSGSTWTNAGELLVGESGLASMEVLAGGLVESASVSLGSGTGSEGRVRVNGFDAGGVNSRLGITGNLLVGDAGTGKLLVDNAGVLDNQDGTIGNSADSTDSRALVTGTGSTWTNRGTLSVGNGGQGILEILDGGHVESASGSIGSQAGADGKVRVSGVDSAGTRSSWQIDAGNLTVGDAGIGLLLVEAGGRVRNQHGFIGNTADSTGSKVTVTGEGSAWINDHGLWVGNAGSGELQILDGGVAGSMEAVVANVGDGTVLVDGEGSRWDIGGTFAVGNFGLGQVTLRNGGVVTSMYGVIGSQGQARSTVLVQGAGSSWAGLEALYVGLEGNAALTIADGGRVAVSAGMLGSGVVLGEYGGSSGILNIGTGGAAGLLDAASITGGAGSATLNFNHDEAGYAFTNDGTAGGTAVLIDGSTTVNQIGTGTTVLTGANTYTGATNVNAGTLLVEGSLGNTATTVADGGTLGGSGSIAGDVTIADGGTLAPGSSAGTLTIGSLSLSSGSTLDYELGQAGVIGGGVNDLIEVGGNLTLDGTLDITDIGGFGAGVYRLINYGGDLADKGLEIGAVPDDGDPQDLFVQTAIDSQVNLVNSAGLTLSFWDGPVASEHNNTAIDGGDGTWTGNDRNWTQAGGALNGQWDNGEFAVFGGTAGTVDVVGEQAIAGLQFMSGYTLAAGTDGVLSIDNAESVIRVDPDVTATIVAPITGAGGLVKTDTGTLVLSGENSYEGGTRIDLGTLQVASDANLGDVAGGMVFDGGVLQTTAAFDSARSANLQADGGRFLTDTNLGLSGAITGAGALTKDGAGTLTLTGANAYTGGTRVLEGTLIGDTGSIRGNLANDGNVVFNQADDATFAGTVVGTGTMAKGGAGTLTLTGNNTPDWTIDAGTLTSRSALFSGDASIADGALLRFDEQDDGRYAGALSGAGRFEIVGGDTVLAMTGNSAGFAGTTSLESGTLQLDGALGGNTLIAKGAWLTGTGRLGSVDNHGTIAAGESIGTLILTGNYVHHDDATLLAEIEPGGDSDLLDIGGTATLEGGGVEIVKLPGQYEGGTRYTLLDAVGGVNGTFGTLDQDLPFLDLLLGYDASHVYLDVQRNGVGFNIVCGDGTFNQCQVAGALDRLADGEITDDLQATLAEVTTLDLPGAPAAFDRLSGEAHGSLAGLLLEGHALYGQAVSRRIAERRDETGSDRLHGGAWMRAYGNNSDLAGNGNAHAADFQQRGLALGFDAWGDEHWLIGASFNAMSLDADFRPGDRGEADTRDASLYATFESARAYLDVVTSFAWWDNEIIRRIEVGSSVTREARSQYGGHRFATHLEAGWNFALGERQQLTPLVSIEYAKLDQEGFREDGAQDLDLIGRSQDVERTTVTAGLRWSTAFARGTWRLEPTVQARWLHAFGDEHAEQALAFAGAPEIVYRVRGVGWPQDRGLLGVGLRAGHGDNLELFVDVDYQKGGGLEAKNLGAGVRWRW